MSVAILKWPFDYRPLARPLGLTDRWRMCRGRKRHAIDTIKLIQE
ncbi:hypothetical protein LY04_02008 [Oceanimonas baumannii]|uniref:Uncharacterized protein n=1 Tax=Oceanimonas baumannii TaxID=129578 RepID=A0ABY2EY03_9GAMM|nr:hypothetical protein LY04_02008 [Oceanimonas baumannii]